MAVTSDQQLHRVLDGVPDGATVELARGHEWSLGSLAIRRPVTIRAADGEGPRPVIRGSSNAFNIFGGGQTVLEDIRIEPQANLDRLANNGILLTRGSLILRRIEVSGFINGVNASGPQPPSAPIDLLELHDCFIHHNYHPQSTPLNPGRGRSQGIYFNRCKRVLISLCRFWHNGLLHRSVADAGASTQNHNVYGGDDNGEVEILDTASIDASASGFLCKSFATIRRALLADNPIHVASQSTGVEVSDTILLPPRRFISQSDGSHGAGPDSVFIERGWYLPQNATGEGNQRVDVDVDLEWLITLSPNEARNHVLNLAYKPPPREDPKDVIDDLEKNLTKNLKRLRGAIE